ncbi:hypothetical protein HDU97_001715 [Phlyctochytrium planicorne]|nr:hypothetical protein HDU97_001715 [Phlyctochytrium planicorne]
MHSSFLILLATAASMVSAATAGNPLCDDYSKLCSNIQTPTGFTASSIACSSSLLLNVPIAYPAIYGLCSICPSNATTFDSRCTIKTIKKADGVTFWKGNGTKADLLALDKALKENCLVPNNCPSTRTITVSYRDESAVSSYFVNGQSVNPDPVNKVSWYVAGTCACNPVNVDGVTAPSNNFTIDGFNKTEVVDAGLVITAVTSTVSTTTSTATSTSTSTTVSKPNGAASNLGSKLWIATFALLFTSILSL